MRIASFYVARVHKKGLKYFKIVNLVVCLSVLVLSGKKNGSRNGGHLIRNK